MPNLTESYRVLPITGDAKPVLAAVSLAVELKLKLELNQGKMQITQQVCCMPQCISNSYFLFC